MILKFLIFCFAFVSILVSRFNRKLSSIILATILNFFAFVFSFTPTTWYFMLPVTERYEIISEQLSIGSGIVESVALGNATLYVVTGFNTYDYLAFYVFLSLLVLCIVDLFIAASNLLKKKEEG